VSIVENALQASGLEPGRLIIEITEGTATLDVTSTLSVLEDLNRLGIGIALDNFGTGSTSLSYLVLLNPKFVKIDQTFVRPPRESTHHDSLLEMIISLGNRLDMTMLAEGIETTGQLKRLRTPGCELSHGFLFSAAVPAEDVPALLDRDPGSTWRRQDA
jgi:EAL domain-containing protein (putative c-di-GMP-specific phosphodiesterase class I)